MRVVFSTNDPETWDVEPATVWDMLHCPRVGDYIEHNDYTWEVLSVVWTLDKPLCDAVIQLEV